MCCFSVKCTPQSGTAQNLNNNKGVAVTVIPFVVKCIMIFENFCGNDMDFAALKRRLRVSSSGMQSSYF